MRVSELQQKDFLGKAEHRRCGEKQQQWNHLTRSARRDCERERPARARAAASPDGGALSEEFVLADLQDARAALEEVSGRRATEDLFTRISSTFCIGK